MSLAATPSSRSSSSSPPSSVSGARSRSCSSRAAERPRSRAKPPPHPGGRCRRPRSRSTRGRAQRLDWDGSSSSSAVRAHGRRTASVHRQVRRRRRVVRPRLEHVDPPVSGARPELRAELRRRLDRQGDARFRRLPLGRATTRGGHLEDAAQVRSAAGSSSGPAARRSAGAAAAAATPGGTAAPTTRRRTHTATWPARRSPPRRARSEPGQGTSSSSSSTESTLDRQALSGELRPRGRLRPCDGHLATDRTVALDGLLRRRRLGRARGPRRRSRRSPRSALAYDPGDESLAPPFPTAASGSRAPASGPATACSSGAVASRPRARLRPPDRPLVDLPAAPLQGSGQTVAWTGHELIVWSSVAGAALTPPSVAATPGTR